MVEIPVTPSQRSLLFIQEAVPRKDLYNISFRVVFDAPVDPEALRQALDRLIAVQPTLRTRFDLADGEPVAEIRPPMPAPLDVVTLDCPAERWPELLAQQSREFAATPVDLRQAPLCRFRLLVGPAETALLCTIHHAINDGVSMRVFLDELVQGYRQAVAAEQPGAVDVAQRERWLAGELAAQCRVSQAALDAGEVEALAATLTGVPPTLLYPVPERPVDTRFHGRLLRTVLPPQQRAALEQAARRLGTTPYCVLLACYALLLGDYSGNAQVVVGGPFVNRRTIASHDLCGFFVNTLPVVLPSRHRPFDEQCAEVTTAVRGARRFQSIPFDALVAAVAPERTSNRNPLFQCMFAMQDDLVTRRDVVPGLGMRLEYTHNETAKFDIWLAATPVSDGLELELEWDADLLPDAYAHRFLDEYTALLTQVVTDPTGHTGPMVAASAHRRPPALHAGDRADTADRRGLLALVLAAAEARPDAVAISAPGEPELSYAGLVEQADRIAAALTAEGVGAGDVVAIVPHSLPETTAAMVAILRCGAAYLPLDLALPADRLSYMLHQARCRFVLSPVPVTADEPARASVGELVERGAGLPPPPLPSGTDPVYVMFTSGSTGRPKGVQMGQDPLVNLLRWQIDEMGLDPSTRFLQYAPLGFDVSYQEIFPTLVAGGTVCGLGATDRRDLDAVARLVDRDRLTHIYLPVAVLGAFAAAVTDADLALADLAVLNVSGEQLHLDSRARALLARLPGRRLINQYGPTETHAVTTHTLHGGPGEQPSHVPIGLPLAGVDVHLLDADGRPVPPGAAGEVFLGGICPADGYVNDPERTEAAFRPDPFAPPGIEPAGRMYRTGDLAVAADGPQGPVLVFLGRRDGQVKIRGHRVELGEVEIAAERLPAVAAAAAAVHGSGESAALCLFVRSAPGESFDERAIRAALQQTLPTYMIPKHLVTVETIPLTPNGKVDRSALAARFASGDLRASTSDSGAVDWSPTPTEELLARLWERLLGRRPQSPQDSFFVLGGTSFDMLKLIGALRTETGLRIGVSDVFRRPALAELAALVDERTAAVPGAAADAGGPETPAPLALATGGASMSTVVAAVRRWALTDPARTALVCGEARVSYRELWERAGRVAAALRERRVGPGDLVALHGPGTVEFVVAGLGSWLAGAAWLPVDPQLPTERIDYLLHDSGARIVLDTGARTPAPTALPVTGVAALLATAGQSTSADDETGPGDGDLAYVIYTSGSTGAPKGVCVAHGPLALHLRGAATCYGYTDDDVSLSFSSPSFDASVEEVWLPLMVGAALVLRGAALWTGPQLFDRIRTHRITRLQTPTAYFEAFFGEELTDADLAALATVRGIYFGGEAVSAAAVRRWSTGPLGHIPIHNTYGPTEAIITSTCRRIDQGWTGERVPIGSALPGHELLLLDVDGQEAGPGQPAELYLGGPCLARGYLNRDTLTAERFVRLPGRTGVFYRTGDLVRLDDGELHFLGRTDRQVKLRGFRIELEEVEAALLALPQVRNAVVLLDTDAQDRPRLTGAVVPHEPATEELPATLRRLLADRLPAYMVPERILLLAELPMNATGKIDRQRVLAVTGGAR